MNSHTVSLLIKMSFKIWYWFACSTEIIYPNTAHPIYWSTNNMWAAHELTKCHSSWIDESNL